MEKEYIEREAAINVVINNPYRLAYKTGKTIQEIKEIPTADVVPKSEVEWLYKQVDCLLQEVMYNDDIAKMKVDEAKAEVAREIFEEIESKKMFLKDCVGNMGIVVLFKDIAELKKKYTE